MTVLEATGRPRVGVVGGGSWGTVLAHLAASNDRPVTLWVRDPEAAEAINATRRNAKYLPELELHPGLTATTDLASLGEQCGVILVVVPSHALRETMARLGDTLDGSHILIHAIKGIEPDSFMRMSQILLEETSCKKVGVLSGPNLAKEVAMGHPSATVIASGYQEVIEAGSEILRSKAFRVYGNPDVVGTEIGGSLKNIMAIASGLADGLGFGDNTKALLLTRGLAEIMRLGVGFGADPMTFSGLSGIGDLMATCFSPLSRNYQVGNRLAKGESLEAIQADMRQVAEGVRTTRTVARYARTHGIYMPITEGIYRIVYEGATPKEALSGLLDVSRNPYEGDAARRAAGVP
ncbi:Glycerol-3-phosphate dehydrogenase [NAD(P)+] [compost metagenome]